MSSQEHKNKLLEKIQSSVLSNTSRFVTPKHKDVSEKHPLLSYNRIYDYNRVGWKINSNGKNLRVIYIRELSLWFDNDLFRDVGLINPN